jgi:replication factor C large subunit
MNWTEKYRPKNLSEIYGQDEAKQKAIAFFNTFPKRKKSILLNGPPGIGKTTLVLTIKNEFDLEIFELNASDFRSKKQLQEKLKPVIEQSSLFKKRKLILVDEVDGILGLDRGGIPELIRLIQETNHPILCTANDAWGKKLNPLRKVSELIELKNLKSEIIKKVLLQISEKEKVKISEDLLQKISENSKGDLRAAINDLQAISSMENPEEYIVEDQRNKETDIFNALREIFQDKASLKMLSTFDKINMPLDEIILWVEENIPKVYKEKELAKAIEKLTNVDIFRGRIYKQQYWRFLVYENAFLSYGISVSKEKEKTGFYKYSKPERILKIWLNNQKHGKKKSISEKYAKLTHNSTKKIMKDWRIIKQIINSNPKIQKQLKLDSDEISYLGY